MEGITASMATIPGREAAMADAVESLLPQVDHVFIYLNGAVEVPTKIDRHPDTHIITGKDIGDAGKFAPAPGVDGYHLTCDDDLIYLPGYASLMCRAVDRYQRSVVVTLQCQLMTYKRKSFYRDKEGRIKYSLQAPLENDVVGDIPGTGVMCYHTDNMRFLQSAFPMANMADLWAGLKCAKEKIPIVCPAHSGREVRLTRKVNHFKDTIWAWHLNDDAVQTYLANEIFRIRNENTIHRKLPATSLD